MRREWTASKDETARSWRDVSWHRSGYSLEYRVRSPGDTPDTGWHLYGPNGHPFGEWMGRTLASARNEADTYITRRETPCRS